MPGRTSMAKTSLKVDAELKVRIISVLDEAIQPTLEWIKMQDLMLSPYTTQKLARLMTSLIDMGLVKKAKSRSTGKMVYRLTAKMKEDGYDV